MMGLACITGVSWAYVVLLGRGVGHMNTPRALAMPAMEPWGFVGFTFTFVMWSVMMVAMMIPTAAPMILLFATGHRRRYEIRSPSVATGSFLLGYVTAWVWFSLFAALGQWGLHSAGLLSPLMMSNSSILGGTVLLSAGIYQFTPLKHACLKRCRSPLGFLLTEWREGNGGAFLMGLMGGNYCVGCCWALMALMFVGGVMSLLWMALLALLTLLEKIVPQGRFLAWGCGVLLISWGSIMLLEGIL
jgi:predicted metal-binding membrane protein